MKIIISVLALVCLNVYGAVRPSHEMLLKKFSKEATKKQEVTLIKKAVLKEGPKSVPVLTEVMKNSKYPDKNRWIATFLLGRVMGKKSAPFIAKFVAHPNWVMRVASLKTLLALKSKEYGGLYAKTLNDDAYLVRAQALDNIRSLKLKKYGANVWAMLYDKKNYYQSKKRAAKRTHIIKKVIKVIGELEFAKGKKPLLKMIGKKKYKDIHEDIDYALKKITNLKSPKGSMQVKQKFWKSILLKNTTI